MNEASIAFLALGHYFCLFCFAQCMYYTYREQSACHAGGEQCTDSLLSSDELELRFESEDLDLPINEYDRKGSAEKFPPTFLRGRVGSFVFCFDFMVFFLFERQTFFFYFSCSYYLYVNYFWSKKNK